MKTHKMSSKTLLFSVFLVITFISLLPIKALFDNEIKLNCNGKQHRNVSLTAYYPDYLEESDRGFRDIQGFKLRTLQDFIDDRNRYVTLSMDPDLDIPYGTPVCIPELNKHFGHRIRIEVSDSCSDLKGTGYTRAEICVRSEIDSYDKAVNRIVTLVFPEQ